MNYDVNIFWDYNFYGQVWLLDARGTGSCHVCTANFLTTKCKPFFWDNLTRKETNYNQVWSVVWKIYVKKTWTEENNQLIFRILTEKMSTNFQPIFNFRILLTFGHFEGDKDWNWKKAYAQDFFLNNIKIDSYPF